MPHPSASLSDLVSLLRQDYQIIPVLALEIEWYIFTETGDAVDDPLRKGYLKRLATVLQHLPTHSITTEDGAGQVEAALLPHHDISALIRHTHDLKRLALETAQSMQLTADFSALPFVHDFGSGLHIHLHLETIDGTWVFTRYQHVNSDILSYTIAGLLNHMQRDLPIFTGSANAMSRYRKGYNAPVNVSWGMNNRTTALRLPDQAGVHTEPQHIRAMATPDVYRRIEHRVASSEAKVEDVLRCILNAVLHGLNQKVHASPPTYGNAADDQYSNLTPLIPNLDD